MFYSCIVKYSEINFIDKYTFYAVIILDQYIS
jgi:hypothetical protein